MKNNEWKGYILVLLYALIGAIYYLCLDFILQAYPEISGIELAFWGYLGAVITLSPFFWGVKKMRTHIKNDFSNNPTWLLILIGMLTGVGMVFVAIVLERSTAEMMSLFNNSEIVFGIILGIIFLQETFTKLQWWGVFLAISGFILISQISSEIDILSILLVMSAQLMYAFQNLLIKKYSNHLNPFSLAFVRMNFMLISAFGFFIWSKGESIPLLPFLLLSALVIFAAFGSRVLLYKSFQYINLSKASVWFLWETIFIILGSYIFFSPTTTPLKVIGILCILLGIYCVQKK